MSLTLFYNNIACINVGIISKYSFIILKYSIFFFKFINFLYLNGFINNFIIKKNNIIIFLKYSRGIPVLKKIILESKLHLWRWYRFKRFISTKSLFLQRYKKSELNMIILYTSKGFLFFETAYLRCLGGQFICQIKV